MSSLLLMLAAWSLLIAGGSWARSPSRGAAVFVSQLVVTLLVSTRQRWGRVGRPVAVAWGAAIGYAVYPAVVSLVAWVGHDLLRLAYASPRAPGAGDGLGWLATVVLSPLFEESLYRGQLLPALRDVASPTKAVLLTSALFALSHLTPWSVLTTFLVGLALGSLMLATGSLWLCIGLHGGLNLAFVVSGSPPQRAALPPAAGVVLALLGLWLLSQSERIARA